MKRRIAVIALSLMMSLMLTVPVALADVLPASVNIQIGGYGEGLGVGVPKTQGSSYGWYGGYLDIAPVEYITYTHGWVSSSANDPHAGDYYITYTVHLEHGVSPGETICWIPIQYVSSVSATYNVQSGSYQKAGIPVAKILYSGEISLSSFEVSKTADGVSYSLPYSYVASNDSYFAVVWPSDAGTSGNTVTCTVYVSGLISPISESDGKLDVPALDSILLYPFQQLHQAPALFTLLSTLWSTSIIDAYFSLAISMLLMAIIIKCMR